VCEQRRTRLPSRIGGRSWGRLSRLRVRWSSLVKSSTILTFVWWSVQQSQISKPLVTDPPSTYHSRLQNLATMIKK
jgi:hypothetical protein